MKFSVPSIVLLAAFSVIIFCPGGFALDCIVCSSDPHVEGESCRDGPFDQYKKSCSTNVTRQSDNNTAVAVDYTFCRKIDQTISGQRTIIRQCAASWTQPPNKCIQRIGTHNFKVFHCHCEGDNCNGVGMPAASVLSLFAVLLAALC